MPFTRQLTEPLQGQRGQINASGWQRKLIWHHMYAICMPGNGGRNTIMQSDLQIDARKPRIYVTNKLLLLSARASFMCVAGHEWKLFPFCECWYDIAVTV